MTDPRLQEIAERAERATPGPYGRDCAGRIFAPDGETGQRQIGEAYASADARFWKYARQDIPYLLSEIKARDALIAERDAKIKERAEHLFNLLNPSSDPWQRQIDQGDAEAWAAGAGK